VFLGKGDGTFQSPVGYPAGAIPENMVVGDFNGDGNLDLAVASQFAPPGAMVSILLGNGDGTFKSQLLYTVGANFSFMVAGDFNRDGKLDLAMTNYADSVKIWLGNGDGSFQGVCCQGPQNIFPAGPNPEGITTGDFNRDGKMDLAVTNSFSNNSVSVLLGKDDGTFTLESTGAYAVGSEPIAIATGDFNGDGKPDLAVGNALDNSISVLINTVKTIKPPPGFTITATPNSATVKAGQGTTIQLTVTPTGGFNSQIDFSCSGVPASIVCFFQPSSVTPNGGPVTTVLQINTVGMAQLESPLPPSAPRRLLASGFGVFSFGIVGMMLAPGSRKKLKIAPRIVLFALLLLGMLLSGCGGGNLRSPVTNLTPAFGSNQIVIAAHAGNMSQQTMITLQVTP
jgi:hypothetical protein